MPIDAVPLVLATLPRIVAGPVLRRLTRSEVSVWVATLEPAPITLTVRSHVADGTGSTMDTRNPIKVGARLWMTVLTGSAPGGTFVPGRMYEYELDAPWATDAGRINWADLSLGSAEFPTFLAPPAQAADLVVAHTSCRKPHGGGRDGLALLMDELDARFDTSPPPQPHLLVLSGDQIYADEVGHALMPRILRIAADLVGIDETDVFGPPPPIGGRGPRTRELGYTGATANHLWTFGEFVAMYLLTWSPVLWANPLPGFPPPAIPPDVDSGVSQESWEEEQANIQLHVDVLPLVRKVLANIPSVMICDDHEITDDWNIDFAWVNSVYAKDGGRRAVTNGMMAYLICQHWGNKPAEFDVATSPESLALALISEAGTTGQSTATTAAPLLGVPTDVLPSASPARTLRDLTPGAIRYDLTLGPEEGWPGRIVLLDERTVREYSDEVGHGARISLAGLAVQLPPPVTPAEVTLVVAATPIVGTELIEHMLQPAIELLVHAGARFADFESWSAVTANHQDVLARLAAHHPVAVLSGDVHYGFTSALTRVEGGATTRLAQFTSSAAKNLETKNSLIGMFSELIMRLGIERTRETSGYAALSQTDQDKLLAPPPAGSVLAWDETVDVLLGRPARARDETPAVLATPVASAYGLATPDWTYTVDPVDDPMRDYAASTVDLPWEGWDPQKSLTMTAALHDADLERISRMFVGLPMIGVVTFAASGGSVTATQELRCPVGRVEAGPGAARQVIRTAVTLA